MRDKKDNATLELPGFAFEPVAEVAPSEPKRGGPRPRRIALKQEQLDLLDTLGPTDITGLPAWQRDEGLDLTGLPIWAPA